ncbi:MAG: hypothetical protein E7408_05735 [Ruminococcaceae bacterium]|nr:hypothetical protein [Oscillospiraceae bacterium]
MLKRLFFAIDNVTGLPRRIMLCGLLPALILLVFAAWLYLRPQVSYADFLLSRQICKTAVTLFSEGIVLGLFLDAVLKR